jgi:hypothetical protein
VPLGTVAENAASAGARPKSASVASPGQLPPYITQYMDLDKLHISAQNTASISYDRTPWDASPINRAAPDTSLGAQKLYGARGELKPAPLDMSVNLVKKSIENVRSGNKLGAVSGKSVSSSRRPLSAPIPPAYELPDTSFRNTYQSEVGQFLPNYAEARNDVLGMSNPRTREVLEEVTEEVESEPSIHQSPPMKGRADAGNDNTASNVMVENLPQSPTQMARSMFPPRRVLLMEDYVSVRVVQPPSSGSRHNQQVRPASAGGLFAQSNAHGNGAELNMLPYIVRISDVGVEVPASYLQPSTKNEETPTTVVNTSSGVIVEVTRDYCEKGKDGENMSMDDYLNEMKTGQQQNQQLFVSMKQLRRLAYRCGKDKLAYQLRTMRCRDQLAGLYECIADHIDDLTEQELCDTIMRCIDIVHIVKNDDNNVPRDTVQIVMLVDSN